MYLAEAEMTPELRDHVFAYNPEIIYHFLPNSFLDYLNCVRSLVRLWQYGPLYKYSQLDRILVTDLVAQFIASSSMSFLVISIKGTRNIWMN